MSSAYFDPAVGGNGTTVTDDSNVTTGLANGGHRTRFVPALAQVVAVADNTVTKATEASGSASTAAGHATTASNWATKTDNFVSGSDNSAKSWSVGGTGSGDPTAGSSKDWATKTSGTVDGSDYSSKEYAVGTTVPVGSAKEWSTQTGTMVDGVEYSAKEYASGTVTQSSKQWATKTSGTVDGSEYSAKYYAQQSSAAASASGARWNFDSSTTMADPGTGEIRLNNATFSSVTQIAVSALSADSGNPDISDYILTWDDSTSTVKGVLSIRELGAPDSIVVFKVSGTITDNGVWLQIPVTYVMSSGSVTNGNQLVAQFSASGDAAIGSITATTSILKGDNAGNAVGATAGTDFVAPAAVTTFSATQNFAASGVTLKGSSTGVTTFTSANASATNYTLTIPSETMEVGFRNIPQNAQSTAYSLVLTDAGKHILHPSADTTARIFTIPANASVAFPIGTAITFVNQVSAGVLTIAITTDTMRLAGAGTTGSRTLAANGVATAVKLTSTEWIISGGSSLT